MLRSYHFSRTGQAWAAFCALGFSSVAHAQSAPTKGVAPPPGSAQTVAVKLSVGSTRIATWKGDKKAVFLLMFDDSIPSHVKTVVPELQKRNLIGTFYVNPGRDEWKPFSQQWEKELPAKGMVYANHTWTHQGMTSPEQAEEELSKTNEAILKIFPGKAPRLISFGRPGVAKEQWTISEDELKKALAKHHLIERPPFGGHGAMIALKTADEMLALADKAIAAGSVEYIVFHGVGAEWIMTPIPTFTTFLDGLVTRREQLWITDHISAHQYETERQTAQVTVLEANARHVRLGLKNHADAQFYDLPLTLITQVPAGWQQCEVAQGSTKTRVIATNGTLQFEAQPNVEIVIKPIEP